MRCHTCPERRVRSADVHHCTCFLPNLSAFRCDDVIRRAHVSRKKRGAGCCTEMSRMYCLLNRGGGAVEASHLVSPSRFTGGRGFLISDTLAREQPQRTVERHASCDRKRKLGGGRVLPAAFNFVCDASGSFGPPVVPDDVIAMSS